LNEQIFYQTCGTVKVNMLRISFLELGITCGLIALVIIIPIVIKRGYASINKRLKKIEDEVSKK